MSALFEPFPKMGRLTRQCVITEKIDGTNAQVNIVSAATLDTLPDSGTSLMKYILASHPPLGLYMFAGSRTRYVMPGKEDNAGFAAWVQNYAHELWALGEGRHFGEWWGQKIQRGYGLQEKRFSLFNSSRWLDTHGEMQLSSVEPPAGQTLAPACCHVVPVLFEGLFSERVVDGMLTFLKARGSVAAPGFALPEGIVIYHTAVGTMFKKTLDNDGQPKSAVISTPPDIDWAARRAADVTGITE